VYTIENRKEARDLFIQSGKTYDELAEETGISVSQLKEWGRRENWIDQRDEFERTVVALDGRILKAISSVVDKISAAYEESNREFSSQDMFAHGKAIESLVIAAAYSGRDLGPVLQAVAVLRQPKRQTSRN
jgi:uncharacterized protein YjcR